MSDFWSTSDNDDATNTGTSFESGGGNIDPIPDNTTCLAMPDEAKWATKDDAEYISLRWRVAKPAAYENRVIFQKLFVSDDDPNVRDAAKMDRKRDKAKRMLAAIDANAGGKLMKKRAKPTDVELAAALIGRPMTVKVMLWEMEDREKPGATISGNWIASVSAKSSVPEVAKPVARSTPAATTGNGGSYGSRVSSDDLDTDVPF